MTLQDLLDQLNEIPDKSIDVYVEGNDFRQIEASGISLEVDQDNFDYLYLVIR